MKFTLNFGALLVLAILVFSVKAQISQEAAGTAASYLIPQGSNENYVVQPTMFNFNNNNYWLVGIYPSNSNSTPNILVAVDSNSGKVVNDNSTLQDLYNLFFETSMVNKFNSNSYYSAFTAGNLNSLSTALLNNVSVSQQALQQVQGLAPQINFYNVSLYLSDVYNDVSIMNSDSLKLLQTQSLLNQSQLISDATFNMSYGSYSLLLNDFYNVIIAINSFDTALNPIANNLTQSKFSRTDLLSTIYYIYPSAPNPQSFKLILNYYNNIPTLSNSSAYQAVSNFESRVVEIQAENEFSTLKTQVSALSSSTVISTLNSNGFNFSKLASDWNTLVIIMNSKSAYPQAITLMSRISLEVQQAQSILSTPSTPAVQPQPALSSDSLYEFIAIVVVLIIAYYAYLRYKKSQKSDVEEEG
jgi:hypothetical protein